MPPLESPNLAWSEIATLQTWWVALNHPLCPFNFMYYHLSILQVYTSLVRGKLVEVADSLMVWIARGGYLSLLEWMVEKTMVQPPPHVIGLCQSNHPIVFDLCTLSLVLPYA